MSAPGVAHLGLGSNLGDRRAMLQAAVDGLAARGVRAVVSSSTYETDPVGEVLDQPAFLNACLAVQTALEPDALLDAVKDVERSLGRTTDGPEYVHHGPRPIDVDVLLAFGAEHRSARLTVPLLEIDFALATPGGVALADALAALPVTEAVRRAGPPLTTPR
jgi:2-amino-4-hydroxy-6-hydroxymethyldihydropteridine diphosphokinase